VGRPQAATDEVVLAATARAVGRHGPARMTLAHVAEEAGITGAAIVQRFGSKRNLLLAVNRSSVDAARVAGARALARSGSPLAALRRFLVEQVADLDSPEVLANHVAFLQLDLVDPDLRHGAQEHARVVVRAIEDLLRAAVEAGELAGGTDCRRLALAVHTTYNGALITWALVGRATLGTWLNGQVRSTLDPHLAPPTS
jgi:AcrR family transcriptional regulator